MSYQTLEYKENKDMFDNNIPAFMTLLNELQPEVIYVIDKAVKEAEKYAEEDKKRREVIEVRNQGDNLVLSLEKMLRENGDKVSEEDKKKLLSLGSLAVICVIGLVVFSGNPKDEKDQAVFKEASSAKSEELSNNESENLEDKLENILAKKLPKLFFLRKKVVPLHRI